MNSRRGFALIWIIVIAIIVVAVAAAVYYFVLRQPASVPTYSPPSTQAPQAPTQAETPIPAVNKSSDLTTAVNDMDSTNIDSLNSQLDQNAADAAGF